MTRRPDEMPPLDYARLPAKRPGPGMALLGGLLAVIVGLFGGVLLYFGLPGLVHVLRKGNRSSPAFAGDVFETAMFVIIGVFCVAVAIRWVRSMVRVLALWAGR